MQNQQRQRSIKLPGKQGRVRHVLASNSSRLSQSTSSSSHEGSASRTIPPNKKRRQDDTWIRLGGSGMGPVHCAVHIVCSELRSGMWPNSFQLFEILSGGARDNAESQAEATKHMNNAAASLEHFGMNVLYPRLMPSTSVTSVKWSPSDPPRSFFATLLALREVLSQNARHIFGDAIFAEANSAHEEAPSTASSSKANTANNISEFASIPKQQQSAQIAGANDSQITKENEAFVALSLATAVITAAIESSYANDSAQIHDKFLDAAVKYDHGHEEFASHLTKRDGRACGVLQNGKRLNEEENIAMTISYNRACDVHPLQKCKRARLLKLPRPELIEVPEPNACHVVILDEQKEISKKLI